MWIILAVIAFLAAQAYLFRSLGGAERFLEQQEEPGEKEILSIAFAEPAMAERMAQLLADFSCANPEIELVLRTDPAVPDAVFEGRAAIGFLPLKQDAGHGLFSVVLKGAGQKILWKSGVLSTGAATFVRYLQERVEISGEM